MAVPVVGNYAIMSIRARSGCILGVIMEYVIRSSILSEKGSSTVEWLDTADNIRTAPVSSVKLVDELASFDMDDVPTSAIVAAGGNYVGGMAYELRPCQFATTSPTGAWRIVEFGFRAKVIMAHTGTEKTLPVWEVHMVR